MFRMIKEKKESLGEECRHRFQLKKRKKYHQFFKGYHKDMNTIFCPITTTSTNVCSKNKYDVQTMFRKRSISVRHPISFSCCLIEPTENSEDVYKLIERINKWL